MDISVIIVNWNTKKLLLECIESLVRELDPGKSEIIVVDNNSSDDSVEAVSQQYPSVRIIRNSANLGFAKANNIGITHAEGDFIALVNSDIKVLDGCFKNLNDHLKTDTTAGIAGPKVLNPDGSYQLSTRRFPSLWNNFVEALGVHTAFRHIPSLSGEFMWLDGKKEPERVDILSGCFWFIRAEALKAVGVLDETFFFYGEDKDFCMRFHKAGWDTVYVPSARVIHHGGASASLRPIEYYCQLQRAYIQFWKKYYPVHMQFLFLGIKYVYHILRLVMHGMIVVLTLKSRKKSIAEVRQAYKGCIWLLANAGAVMRS